MSSRDAGFLALGRFLAVERYRQSSPPSSTHPVRGSRPTPAGGPAGTPGSDEFPASRYAPRHRGLRS